MAVAPPPYQPGQRWAYRSRAVDPYVKVELLQFGNNRQPCVQIRFIGGTDDGRQEWVNPKWLRALWTNVGDLIAAEKRWKTVRALGQLTTSEDTALFQVFELLVDTSVATLPANGQDGVVSIAKPDQLAALAGLEVHDFENDAAFMEAGHLIVPWPVSKKIAVGVLRMNPDPMLQKLNEEEAEADYEAVYGGRSPWNHRWLSPEECGEIDAETRAPVRGLLRTWIGVELIERFNQQTELRNEISRLRRVVDEAIKVLDTEGKSEHADELRRQLESSVGEPVR